MGVRWIRLDVTWSQSEWLEELPPASRLAWVELLCYVKAFGVAGSVKRPSNVYLAKMWGLSKSSIEVMYAAAFHDSALVMDGPDLIVTGWSDRQSDPKAAARMRDYRKRQQGESPNPDPPAVTAVTRNRRNTMFRARAPDTHRDTHRDKDTTEKPSSLPPSRATAWEDGEDLEREIRTYILEARTNIVAIHGGTEEDVTIKGQRVGVGIDVDVYKRLCREELHPPKIIAAAIAFIPTISDLAPPVSLARWGAEGGRPIYEQCLNRAYKEASL